MTQSLETLNSLWLSKRTARNATRTPSGSLISPTMRRIYRNALTQLDIAGYYYPIAARSWTLEQKQAYRERLAERIWFKLAH